MTLQFAEKTLEPDIAVLELQGRMHLGNRLSDAEWAARQIVNSKKRKLILDITGVEYIDSAALGMLVFVTGEMARKDGKAVLVGANQRVTDVITLAHVDQILTLAPDMEAAKALLAR